MTPEIKSTVLRFISYGWRSAMIVSIVQMQYGAEISTKDVDELRK